MRSPKLQPSLRLRLGGIGFGEIVISAVLVTGVVAGTMPGYLRSRERTTVAQAYDRIRTTASAVDAYFIDHGVYPASGIASGGDRSYEANLFWQPTDIALIPAGVPTINSFAKSGSGATRLVTFRIAGDPSIEHPDELPALATLTTPIAYLPRFLEDPFARTRGASFGYFGHASNLGFIVFSLGPDRDENVAGGPGDINPTVERLFNVESEFPSMWRPPNALIHATYDPTNGLISDGDVYRSAGQ